MKNVISKIFVILLITFFFCSCSSGISDEIPTEPPAVTFHAFCSLTTTPPFLLQTSPHSLLTSLSV